MKRKLRLEYEKRLSSRFKNIINLSRQGENLTKPEMNTFPYSNRLKTHAKTEI